MSDELWNLKDRSIHSIFSSVQCSMYALCIVVYAFQAGSHALTGGGMAGAQGGSFLHGAASGAFSSIAGSGIGALSDGRGWQILGGTISGGVGSSISGGSFLQGATQGAITSSLNHAIHSLDMATSVDYTNKALNNLFREYWRVKPTHLTTLEIATSSNIDSENGYYVNEEGNIKKQFGRGTIGGRTIPARDSGSSPSRIVISQLSFNNKGRLIKLLGHELFHEYLFNTGVIFLDRKATAQRHQCHYCSMGYSNG